MNKTVKMLVVVSLTMAFAAFLYRDRLGSSHQENAASQPSAQPQETASAAPAEQKTEQKKADTQKPQS